MTLRAAVEVRRGTFVLDAQLDVDDGEVVAVLGPNGAGKTTLLDVITGKTRPTRGGVKYQPDGKAPVDITRLPEQRIARLGVGRKFQTPNVFKSLTVLDILSGAAAIIAEGEVMQMKSANNLGATEEHYLEVVKAKTAALFAAAAESGAVISGRGRS